MGAAGEQETKPLSRLQLLLESISAQPASAAELPPGHLIRAEKLNDSICYCGSSIRFKAEVTLKVGECTKDALLSRCLGESTCMCIYWGKVPISGDLRKKVTCYCHGFFYFVIISEKWIFMLATEQLFVDMIIVSFLCDNCCCFKFLVDQCFSDLGPSSSRLIFVIILNLSCY